MAKVKVYSLVDNRLDLFDKSDRLLSVDDISERKLEIKELNHKTKITELNNSVDFVDIQARIAVAETILPFKVRFTNIDIPGYGAGNVPPIGIAIVGVNNFIL